ncbi:MAG: hypothetical protein NPIRA04_12160 [Nitrospirales bacterium]|nr:MAG: hypothetical protein NPIRA04_12160 [Nitrospirales bacterium]
MGKTLRFIFVLFVLTILTACTGVHLPETPSWKEVPIMKVKDVAGKWEGTTWVEPQVARQDDWVKVRISEDGRFEFASYRMTGAWLGNGNLLLENGKLVTESKPDTGSATFTLYESRGKRMLKVQGTTKTGLRQAAELTPLGQ